MSDSPPFILSPDRRLHLHRPRHLGDAAADAVVGAMGSWRFIVIQTVVVSAWIAGNVYLLFNFDPVPFILLNLVFSTQAAYASPLILMASNRQSQKDRARDDLEAREVDQLFKINTQIHEINKRQLEILEELRAHGGKGRGEQTLIPTRGTGTDPPTGP